jgi:putative ABC transport system permease protein
MQSLNTQLAANHSAIQNSAIQNKAIENSHLKKGRKKSPLNAILSITCVSMAVSALVLFLVAEALWLLLLATALVILVGCCLLLINYPRVLHWLFKAIPATMPLLQVSAKQSLALSSKTKLACCAFFIAATSNIGMNLMVDSFRDATLNWLDNRLAAEHYLYYRGDVNISELATKAGVKASPRYENYARYLNTEIQQFSYPTTLAFKDAMVFYKVDEIEQAWQSFERSDGIFVNQQFAFYFDVGLNDELTLPNPNKQASEPLTKAYVVKGIIYDFGSPSKQVLLPIREFSQIQSGTFIHAIEGDPNDIEAFRALLEQAGIQAQNRLLSTQALLSLSMDAFDRTFLITDGLNIITLLVAALSLACAIVVLMNDVRPQNMLIRSLGVSATKTQMLALFQYLLLCLVALIFAIPFGILLSWILIYEINLQAFLWTYPLQISVSDILKIVLMSLFVVVLVIAFPLFRAGKRPLIEDIRWLN